MQATGTTQSHGETKQKSHDFTIDASHSHVGFSVRHLMISNVRGEFTKLGGSVTWDPARPETSRIDVEIDVASLNTREEQRDGHLKSADFFDSVKFPKITYRSRGVGKRKRKDGTIEVVGDLTIRGVTRVVVLDVDGPTPEQTDPWGNVRIAASARTTIKRSDFGMTWNSALETGGVLVGDDIHIEIELELVKNK
jgi:polyisoprenoid-binding protein YceI